MYELQYQIPEDFDDVELHYPRFYSQITEELQQKTDGSEISKRMQYRKYDGENGYFLCIQADRGMSLEYGEQEYIGPIPQNGITTEDYAGMTFRRYFFEESGNYVAWGTRDNTFYLLKSGNRQRLDDLLASVSFSEEAEPETMDTSLVNMAYEVPTDREKVFWELHDVIGMGVTYKHIGWEGELYTGVTFNAATKLEYHIATTGTPTDVKINGQPFKSYIPAGSARQMQYVTQFGNDVYEISFVYGDESSDAAFLKDVTFS